MTPVDLIFDKLASLNQNDFIDWLLVNKKKLIEDGKMHMHQRQESSEQSASAQMVEGGE